MEIHTSIIYLLNLILGFFGVFSSLFMKEDIKAIKYTTWGCANFLVCIIIKLGNM